jgi:hypothetical protein
MQAALKLAGHCPATAYLYVRTAMALQQNARRQIDAAGACVKAKRALHLENAILQQAPPDGHAVAHDADVELRHP